MQDHPTVDLLLEAGVGYLREDVMPNTQGRLSFHARVAANVVEMLRRELAEEEHHLANEWAGLDGLLGQVPRPASLSQWRAATFDRAEELSRRIRAGDADTGPWRAEVFAHLRRLTLDRLSVSNPPL
ncbi:MAG: DUF6285 domain-containing protein, partial [Dehalococcoidia bacterium]